MIYNNKEYKLLLETDIFKYFIHDDELIMISKEDGSINDDDYTAKSWFEDSLENIANGTEKEIYFDPYEKQARKELGELYEESKL